MRSLHRRNVLLGCTLAILGCAGSADGPPGDEEGFNFRLPPVVFKPPRQPLFLAGGPAYEKQRLYVAQRNGSLRMIDADPAHWRGGERTIRTWPDVQAMTAFDGFAGQRHVIFADGYGDVHHLAHDDRGTEYDTVIAHLDDVVAMTGYAQNDDLYLHAYAMHSNGSIDELLFVNWGPATVNYNIVSFGPSLGIAGTWNAKDGAHLLVLNQYGLYDVHVPRAYNRAQGPPYNTDFRGKIANAVAVAAFTWGNDSHAVVADSVGAMHHLIFHDNAPIANTWVPNLGSLPGTIVGLAAYVVAFRGYVVAALTNDGNVRLLDGGVVSPLVHYDVMQGEPDFISPMLAGLPAVQIESKICLNPAQRAQVQTTVSGALGKLTNAQAKKYFKNAVFYSACYGSVEKGGLWRIDDTRLSRDQAMNASQIINDAEGTFGFKIQGFALAELTDLVWESIPKSQGTAQLQSYTLSLDSPGHDKVNLHVNAQLDLLPPFPPSPAGVDYTDHLYIDGDSNLKCDSSHSYGAPDEPSVGCLAASVMPAGTPGAANNTLLDYKHVIVDSSGIFADAAPGGRPGPP